MPSSTQRWAWKSCIGDIRDRAAVAAACAGIDCVFHTAAMAGIWGPWKDFHDINVIGTRNVIEACLATASGDWFTPAAPASRSTASDQKGVDEIGAVSGRWLCHYPRTKALAEQEVLAANGARRTACSGPAPCGRT